MIFVFRYQYTIGVVSPFCQAFVDGIKATFKNGASDYRRDSRVWLFDEADEAKVLELVRAHFPQATVKHFISTDELIAVD
jgi:hypothetical protein